MEGEKKSLRPSFAVTNIKSLIPVILDIKQDEYSSWVFLFELHLQAHRLLFLIDGSQKPVDVDAETEKQLDTLCRQWIFATMTKDLMLTVLKKEKIAKEIWDHLKTLFQDNKGSRAANIESKFVNLKFSDCASVDDYCEKLKSLSNRLHDLDFPTNDKRLVIQLVNGFPEEYASFVQQSMPTFDGTRSQLHIEEIRRAQYSIVPSPNALAVAASPMDCNNYRSHHQNSGKQGHKSQSTDKRPRSGPTTSPSANPPLLPTPSGFRLTSNANFHNNQPRGRSPGNGHGQAYLAPTTELIQPTDIAEAYSSMHLQQPDDAFYMDTGTTSHLTADSDLPTNTSCNIESSPSLIHPSYNLSYPSIHPPPTVNQAFTLQPTATLPGPYTPPHRRSTLPSATSVPPTSPVPTCTGPSRTPTYVTVPTSPTPTTDHTPATIPPPSPPSPSVPTAPTPTTTPSCPVTRASRGIYRPIHRLNLHVQHYDISPKSSLSFVFS
ncbi:mucin-7-like [Papaver somniferum]|uniref:mucin-7-like n=1 Tax=Papaver somniferum TaxID=3469 RepID=UPI000E6F8BB1|nr:mucin-7-like [Papaver somniferum]